MLFILIIDFFLYTYNEPIKEEYYCYIKRNDNETNVDICVALLYYTYMLQMNYIC